MTSKTSWPIELRLGLGAMAALTLALIVMMNAATVNDGRAPTPVLSADEALSMNQPDPEHEGEASLSDLTAGLKAKLDANPDDAQGWALYARSLMSLKRYTDAFGAYERLLVLTQGSPAIAEEFARARAYAAQQTGGSGAISGPTAEDIAAAQTLSPADRSAMIEGMVDGLSDKLLENPDDPLAWIKLLRARKVLGQEAQASAEIARMKAHFSAQPITIGRILTQSGWSVP